MLEKQVDRVSDDVCGLKNTYKFIDSLLVRVLFKKLFTKHVFDVTVMGLVTLIIILDTVYQQDEHKLAL